MTADNRAADPEYGTHSRSMNQLIRASEQRCVRYGSLARLAKSPPLDRSRQERMNTAHADREHAFKFGDGTLLAATEDRIDRRTV